MTGLESLKTKDRLLGRQAANSIRRQIVNGTMPPAHRLLETDLARTLEVSRGTIRSALMQLTEEGLVSQVAFTKWEVAPASVHEAWELYTLRAVLEGLAARLASERATPESRAELEKAFDALEAAAKTENREEIIDADFDLHRVLVGMSGHRRLVREHEKLIQQVRFQMTHIGLTARDFHHLLEDHRALKDAVISGDAVRAAELATSHNSAEVERLLAAGASEKSADTGRENPG
ncbi:GntR family transcriptional regulator [Hoeflea sp. G2-23]|uniref:GntR family transcriptional regulator n=1 Tax=Hoeflea algicola TaxID=2983763 RepID=A0ABT3ZFK2_9HYPH|nr:GntR family transcriptional regulator [Hoeflea algicola]MCY0150064.1 GntR family transcriptional regulator [Hoeflea algicola]